MFIGHTDAVVHSQAQLQLRKLQVKMTSTHYDDLKRAVVSCLESRGVRHNCPRL